MTTIPAHDNENAGAANWERYRHQPHWRNNQDEYDAAKFGMWLFLSTELLLFSGMFVAYTIFRIMHTETWGNASHHYLDWRIGAINTVVLLISSWTMVMAIRSAQVNHQRALRFHLVVTILCGLFFLGAKVGFEYLPKLAKGEVPGSAFDYIGSHGYVPSDYDPLFLGLYWVATAIHGSHVLIGVGLLTWCLLRAGKKHFGPKHFTALENVGLFWHLVDLIWIFLFPLLYLVG